MQRWGQQDYVTMPWKNGGGTTTELATFPPSASLAHFVWRLSCAEVRVAGPFSAFPRIDRSLAVLSGVGLILHADESKQSNLSASLALSVRLDQRSLPYRFMGELPIFAELLEPDSPVIDLNLMTRREVCQHYMQRLEAGTHFIAASDAQQLLLYCAKGNAIVQGQENLQAGDLLLLDEEQAATGIRAQIEVDELALLFCMRISFLNHEWSAKKGTHGNSR
jgi:uncharacterized protein